jgi:hypothetical protein
MFESVILGLRRAGFADEEIHYFTLHVEQDEDHGLWLEEALARLAVDDAARAQIRRGALASLEARARFWTGVQREIVRFRQPRAARPDGPVPRSIPHELLLTAWDGWQAGRALPQQVAALWERRRPTLGALLASARG